MFFLPFAVRLLCLFVQIFAELAIVPDAITCGKPNAALLNMLRTALLRVSVRVGVRIRVRAISGTVPLFSRRR